jgi:hypothetical protein
MARSPRSGSRSPAVVDCTDREEAFEAASTVPVAWYGTIEVRPVWEI